MANLARAILDDLNREDELKVLAPARHQGREPKPMVAEITQGYNSRPKWLRFNYKIEDNESGLFGRILSHLFIEQRAFYVEPWPENEWALYMKAEGDNLKRMGEIGREAGLRPVAFTEVQLEI